MTYTIHRYPAELIDVVRLVDGSKVTLRPVLPQDADIMQSFVRTLSEESRRNRFFRALRELPKDLLTRFTNVDYETHLALLAEVFVDGAEVVVGEARYVRGDDSRAEFAVAVADEWHGKGIGRMLLNVLQQRAAAEGIAMIHGQTLPANGAMQAVARKAGFEIAPDPDEPGVLRLEKRIGPHAELQRNAVSGLEPAAVDRWGAVLKLRSA
jgi:RimJ/RimL family protein N-acetyltransferase